MAVAHGHIEQNKHVAEPRNMRMQQVDMKLKPERDVDMDKVNGVTSPCWQTCQTDMFFFFPELKKNMV